MHNAIEVAVAAVNLKPRHTLAPEDRAVPGVYSVMVERDVPESLMASVAMDVFRAGIPVQEQESFSLVAFDPVSERIIPESSSCEPGSMVHRGGNLRRITDHLPNFYTVEVDAVGDDQSVARVGIVQLATRDKTTARNKALDNLWDSRLDAASCTARCHIEPLEAADVEQSGDAESDSPPSP